MHTIFNAIFCAFSDATFVTSVNWRRFLCDSGATFAAVCCDFPKITAKLHQVSNMRDKFRSNRTAIAAN